MNHVPCCSSAIFANTFCWVSVSRETFPLKEGGKRSGREAVNARSSELALLLGFAQGPATAQEGCSAIGLLVGYHDVTMSHSKLTRAGKDNVGVVLYRLQFDFHTITLSTPSMGSLHYDRFFHIRSRFIESANA